MAATRVQAFPKAETTSGTSITNTATTCTAGNLLTIVVVTNPSTGVNLAASDITHSVSATRVVNAVNSNGSATVTAIFYIANISGGSTQIQCTGINASGGGAVMIVQEWSGLATSSPFDVAVPNFASTGSTSHATGTTATTAQNNELIFAADSHNGATGTPSAISNGFSLIRTTSDDYEDTNTFYPTSTARNDQTTTGTQSTTWTWVNSAYANGIATFKEATGGGPSILLLNEIPNNLVRM